LEKLRVVLFKDSYDSFTSELKAADIKFSRLVHLSEAPMAAGFAIEVLQALQSMSPWAAVAAVMIQWIRSRHGREIQITTKDHGIFHAKNLTHEELEEVLVKAKFAVVIDTNKEGQP